VLLKEKTKRKFAGYYFDELVRRGMIQPVDIDHNDKVLSCTVHHVLLDLIRYKSMGDHFVTVLDHSQTDIALVEKVRGLSLHYSSTEVAKLPSNIRLSHVRSLAFFGLSKCMPSVTNFKLLRVIILHLWPDHNEVIYDLSGISELYRLRVLQVSAYHLNVKLPMSMKHLKDLVTFEIEGGLADVPHDIVNLSRLLHLSLPTENDLPDRIGRMISLRALRHFNLSRNSVENVESLGELSNLRDLCLTCSRVVPYQLKTVTKCLSSVLGKLKNLRSLTLDHMPPLEQILSTEVLQAMKFPVS
jgi:Leucine-rich repeat (LRR) protein